MRYTRSGPVTLFMVGVIAGFFLMGALVGTPNPAVPASGFEYDCYGEVEVVKVRNRFARDIHVRGSMCDHVRQLG